MQDVNFLYEMINGLALYEKRPNDMTGSIGTKFENLLCY